MACFVVFVGSADPGGGNPPSNVKQISMFSASNPTPGGFKITPESLIVKKRRHAHAT